MHVRMQLQDVRLKVEEKRYRYNEPIVSHSKEKEREHKLSIYHSVDQQTCVSSSYYDQQINNILFLLIYDSFSLAPGRYYYDR
jgi:hypothetical protein